MFHGSKELNIIQDLYSPSKDLIYKQKEIKAIAQKQNIKEICMIREKQFIEEIGNKKIYDVEILPVMTNRNILNGRVLYEGEVELNFLYEGNMGISLKNVKVPFSYNVDSQSIALTTQIETNINVKTQDFTIMPDESIDMKIDLEFLINITNNQNIQVIEEISEDENRNSCRPSLIIYFVKEGDTLWNIAKKFKSTVNDIAEINNIENENKIDIGQQLFIPNCAKY